VEGDYEMPDIEKGSWKPLLEKSEQVSIVLRTRAKVKPVFVSPGHKVSFDNSRGIILNCTAKYRLPETARQAHTYVN